MVPLLPPHFHTLNAVEGWLGLGLPAEAQAELDQLPAELRMHRFVLNAQYSIHSKRADWDAAHALAEMTLALYPEVAEGWIHRAYAARRRPGGGLDAAYVALLPAAEKFPREGMIPYNLACYCAQKGQLSDAWRWYRAARKIADPTQLRKMALKDEDLKPLWAQITQLV